MPRPSRLELVLEPEHARHAQHVKSDLENGGFDESADIVMMRFQVDW